MNSDFIVPSPVIGPILAVAAVISAIVLLIVLTRALTGPTSRRLLLLPIPVAVTAGLILGAVATMDDWFAAKDQTNANFRSAVEEHYGVELSGAFRGWSYSYDGFEPHVLKDGKLIPVRIEELHGRYLLLDGDTELPVVAQSDDA